MKRLALIVLPGFAAAIVLLCSFKVNNPFDVEKFIRENPLRCASNLHCYEVLDSSVTPAPKGYEPFYISHISRHGSRGHNEVESFRYVEKMAKFDSLGYLTAEGKELLSILQGIWKHNAAEGYGKLTDKGRQEHAGIARRIGENYPQIFSNPERADIRCYSTTVPRVIASMDSFSASLVSMFPSLNAVKYTSKDGKRARSEVSTPGFTEDQKKELDKVHTGPFRDSLLRNADFSRLVNKTFIDGKLPAGYERKAGNVFAGCFSAGAIRQCYLSDTLRCVEPYFTTDELYLFWKCMNAAHMNKWGWTTENKGYRAHCTECILDNIIVDADAAIAGNGTCATFRFSHDSVVLPLLCLIGVKGCDWRGSFREIHEHNAMSYSMHMAGNLQMVFFRNSRNEILVKLLLNEEETVIPALKPDRKGVFYKWERLKEYFHSTEWSK